MYTILIDRPFTRLGLRAYKLIRRLIYIMLTQIHVYKCSFHSNCDLVSSFIRLLGPIKMSVTEFKESGNEKFKAGDYEEALSLYTKVGLGLF